jgi:hypothetical protein
VILRFVRYNVRVAKDLDTVPAADADPTELASQLRLTMVRGEPLGVDLELEPGESVIEVAWRLGYRWPTTCWGQAECMLCRVDVRTQTSG